MTNEKLTLCDYLKDSLEPIDWGDEEPKNIKYSMAFSRFLRDVATLIAILRAEEIRTCYVNKVTDMDGHVLVEGREPHEPTVDEVIGFNAQRGMFGTCMHDVKVNEYVTWLLDEDCPEDIFDIDEKWLIDKWNEFAVLKNDVAE